MATARGEVANLANCLDPHRYRIALVACMGGQAADDGWPLEALGVDIDRAPYSLSFEDTIRYVGEKLAGYDIVISCQDVADIYPALSGCTGGRR